MCTSRSDILVKLLSCDIYTTFVRDSTKTYFLYLASAYFSPAEK